MCVYKAARSNEASIPLQTLSFGYTVVSFVVFIKVGYSLNDLEYRSIFNYYEDHHEQ